MEHTVKGLLCEPMLADGLEDERFVRLPCRDDRVAD